MSIHNNCCLKLNRKASFFNHSLGKSILLSKLYKETDKCLDTPNSGISYEFGSVRQVGNARSQK